MRKFIRGKTWARIMTVTTSAGVGIDMRQYTVKYALKKTRGIGTDYPDETEDVTTSFPITGSGTEEGVLSATVLDTVTARIPKGIYWEEFEVSIGAGASKIVQAWQQQIEVIDPVIG